jgi:hypothetical protein
MHVDIASELVGLRLRNRPRAKPSSALFIYQPIGIKVPDDFLSPSGVLEQTPQQFGRFWSEVTADFAVVRSLLAVGGSGYTGACGSRELTSKRASNKGW